MSRCWIWVALLIFVGPALAQTSADPGVRRDAPLDAHRPRVIA
jgi:hypothetical protein